MSSQSRHGVRLRTRFETLFCSDRQDGEAVLADASHSGALLKCATRPAMGSRVMLYVCLPGDTRLLELRGKVVRHTSGGFAIKYDKPNPDVVRLADDAAAIASVLHDDKGGISPIVDVLGSASARNRESEADPVEDEIVGVPVEEPPMADSGTLGILLERECPTVHNLIMATEAEVIAATEVLADAEVPLGAPMLLSELDLSPYSISEIEALAQRIPGVIAIKRAEARQRILRKIENLAEQEGFSLEELLEKP